MSSLILWQKLHQAAEGLNYLHEQDFIHGNICGVRIAIFSPSITNAHKPNIHLC